MSQLGRILLWVGLSMAAIGVLLMLGERFGLGRLPGDLVWKRKNTTVHFPIVTSLVLSVILTVILNLIVRRK
ncbi:MAG TPA: DUF2905 domain-containing protein [Polyangiales bacterium]|nr:DUF2905 domain-containing protein [Polyangiales bacterium]